MEVGAFEEGLGLTISGRFLYWAWPKPVLCTFYLYFSRIIVELDTNEVP